MKRTTGPSSAGRSRPVASGAGGTAVAVVSGGLQRRLAAVLCADIVGYSALMAQDEERTFATLRHVMRETIGPKIKEHDGRIVKTAGDGVIAEFASAVQAVRSAVAVQERLSEQRRGAGDQILAMRIGINVGDIIVDPDGDIFGDGVNVAARLEQLASSGGICVSGKVHDEVRDKLPHVFEPWGEQQLKNIPRPVAVYSLFGNPFESTANRSPVSRPSRLAVLVRPFTGGSEQVERYLLDGITEDLVTELTRFNQLTVMSFNSSLALKESGLKELAADGEIQYVVEGSVRRTGPRFRISCCLVDVASGEGLWAERFDRTEQDFFDLQDELVGTIVGTLVGRVKAAGAEKARRKPPANLAAYECVLRGNALPMGDIAAEAEARSWYRQAAELDPSYGRAHAKIAHYAQLEWFRDMGSSHRVLEEACELAQKAVALAPNDPVCLNILGWILLHRRDFDVAAQLYARALDLNPNDPEQIAYLGTFYTFAGEPERALQWFERAKALDPYYEPSWYWPFRGLAHFVAHRFELAVLALGRSPTMPVWVTAYLAAAHSRLGHRAEADAMVARTLAAAPDFSARRFSDKEPYRVDADRTTVSSSLAAAGLPA